MEYINGSSVSQQNGIDAQFKSASFANNTVGYSPSQLNYYEEFTANLALSGLGGVSSLAVQICRVGKNITLSYNGTAIGTGQGTNITTAAIPARFWPLATRTNAIPIFDNNASAIGIVSINTAGVLTFSAVGAFITNAQPAQIFGGTLSYSVL